MNSTPCYIGLESYHAASFSSLLSVCADWSLNCAEVRMCVGVTVHDHGTFALSSSGAQGEYAGLAAIKAYLNSKGESARSVSVLLLRERKKKPNWTEVMPNISVN